MSIWWMAGALLLGCYVGVLVMALMSVAAREGEAADKAARALALEGISPVNVEAGWSAAERG